MASSDDTSVTRFDLARALRTRFPGPRFHAPLPERAGESTVPRDPGSAPTMKSAALLLGFLLLSCRASGTAAPAVHSLVLSIGGMTCAVNCPPRVEAALESVEGVQDATVDYDSRTATVVLAGEVEPGLLISALQKQGFGGVVRE